ncbi:ankyrin repeat domain-containing protein, partial [Nocardioides sp.]|uniref:ankyrin repeat domain-containing protein n=1 Tax=Nocardioides sp. TaxID=35761 RepID=UPI002747C7C5|nr:ankyrin repeat domain-containing protein [Nocardioides sp.]
MSNHTARTVLVALALALVLTACGTGEPSASRPQTTGTRQPPSTAPTQEHEMRPTPHASSPTPGLAAQAALDERLRAAAWDNDVVQARRLIRQGADVNAKDETEQSAYLISTSEGYLDLLRLTLRNGARLDDKDSWNGTGLIRAAERGHALVVGQLLSAGIDRDHVNRIGYQAIHEAVWLGQDTASCATTVRVLAAGGVELDRRSPSADLTPLEMAHQRGYTGLQRILDTVITAERPTDPDRALLRAAQSGNADAVSVALRAGARIDARDEHDRTALLLAA